MVNFRALEFERENDDKPLDSGLLIQVDVITPIDLV
jgi:hypothetical protein